MAVCSTPSVLSTNSIPKIISRSYQAKVKASSKITPGLLRLKKLSRNPSSSTRLNAGLTDIEPDLVEDKRDPWATNGIDIEDFVFGEYDGHHTYHEGEDKGTFWGAVAEEYAAAEPPTGFQGIISWLFLPAVVAGLAYHVPGEYLYIGAGIFVVIFCIIEMDKPDKPHNFEPQIYNMERGARDKLIADYNTMDIWDFNEKYGELWDFTVNNENIVKR
ncbi:hypothetical protein BVC80_441g101 [Macleaya cordata]|uniref:Photosynthetic NDH subunit of subcomplex B 5 n=1 Tax=Macleaya cordata TaxID=56857 RepID=A0A200Q4E8_MACCD|nr:hypothetical protein BVC80_441g101 [Macleaya cordata]